jgi:outer membrane protein assembly factor BamB
LFPTIKKPPPPEDLIIGKDLALPWETLCRQIHLVASEQTVAGFQGDQVFALSRADGTLRWCHKEIRPGLPSRPIVFAPFVIVPCWGSLFAFNEHDGRSAWVFKSDDLAGRWTETPAPVFSSAGLCFANLTTLHILELGSGAGLKKLRLVNKIEAMATDTSRNLLFVSLRGDSNNPGKLLAIDVREGRTLWTYTSANHEFSAPCVTGTTVCALASDGSIIGLDVNTGEPVARKREGKEEILRTEEGGLLTDPVVGPKGTLLFAALNGDLHAIAVPYGKARTKLSLGARVFADPVVFKDRVLVGTEGGILYCLALEGGTDRNEQSSKAIEQEGLRTEGKQERLAETRGERRILALAEKWQIYDKSNTPIPDDDVTNVRVEGDSVCCTGHNWLALFNIRSGEWQVWRDIAHISGIAFDSEEIWHVGGRSSVCRLSRPNEARQPYDLAKMLPRPLWDHGWMAGVTLSPRDVWCASDRTLVRFNRRDCTWQFVAPKKVVVIERGKEVATKSEEAISRLLRADPPHAVGNTLWWIARDMTSASLVSYCLKTDTLTWWKDLDAFRLSHIAPVGEVFVFFGWESVRKDISKLPERRGILGKWKPGTQEIDILASVEGSVFPGGLYCLSSELPPRYLWGADYSVASRKGLIRFDVVKSTAVRYTPRDCPLRTDLINAVFPTTDGAWIATRQGLVYFKYTAPPRVVSTVPENGASGVPTDVKIQFALDQDIVETSLDRGQVILRMEKATIPGITRYEADGPTVVFETGGRLFPNRRYTATLKAGMRDFHDEPLREDHTISFTTGQ